MVEKTSPDQVTIERTFPTPPEVIWELWTRPEHFASWYGPEGGTVPVVEMDVRVGGARLLCMEVQTPHGSRRMWFTGTYLEVVENELLVYTDAMADEHGNVMAPEQMGMPAGHPAITEVRVELEPISGGTRMILTHVGIPEGSPGEIGWAMALDKPPTSSTRPVPSRPRSLVPFGEAARKDDRRRRAPNVRRAGLQGQHPHGVRHRPRRPRRNGRRPGTLGCPSR